MVSVLNLIEPWLINNAIITSLVGFLGALFLMVLMGAKLTKTSIFNRFALTSVQDTSRGYTSSFYDKSLIGATGIVESVLRPSGRIKIDNEVYDAYTRGEYLNKGEKIEVIATEGTSLKVKKISFMKVLGIIPSRYESSRFPGKPLIDIMGKTMIQRVYEQAKKSKK